MNTVTEITDASKKKTGRPPGSKTTYHHKITTALSSGGVLVQDDLIPAALPRLVAFDDVRRALGISRSTLDKLEASGEFPKSIKAGARRLYVLDDVQRWIDDRKQQQV